MRFMFDTNVFNRIADGHVCLDCLPGAMYQCTNIQMAEIGRTKNEERRKWLLTQFALVNAKTDATTIKQRSTPWGSPWGSPWDRGGKYFVSILAALEAEKPCDRGNSFDAVIIETCLYESTCFVSADAAAVKVAQSFKVVAQSWEEFKREHRIQEL